MAIRFVSTSILKATSDGDFETGEEVPIDTEETRQQKIDLEKKSNKPLFMQLAERKERQQEEYDANTKKIFAPPQGLDEDDVE